MNYDNYAKHLRGSSKFFSKLEEIIARHCYSDNFETYYRYPVHYEQDGIIWKRTGYGAWYLPAESIPSMYYQFGSNRLYIGKALLELLYTLEHEDLLHFYGPIDHFYEDDELEKL